MTKNPASIKLLFLLPMLTSADLNKHMRLLAKLGPTIEVLGFERDTYPNPSANQFKCTSLGRIHHEHYYKRIVPLFRAFFTLRATLTRCDAVVCCALDLLLVLIPAMLTSLKRPPINVVVLDIYPLQTNRGVKSTLYRWIERWLFKRVKLLTVTSDAYVTEYFSKIQGLNALPYIVVENKVDTTIAHRGSKAESEPVRGGVLRIGYFGFLRCPRSWQILKETVIRSEGRVQLLVRGFVSTVAMAPLGPDWDIAKDAATTDGITYGGPYKSPQDCADIYSQVDVVWAPFPYDPEMVSNSRWARTNRFYESCFYGVPMITATGSQDGLVVDAAKIGLTLDLSDIEAAVKTILSISPADVQMWRDNLKSFPESKYIYTDEHERWLSRLLDE